MTALALLSGAYSAAAMIANAQRAVNVYAEINPKDTQPNMPVTQYARPGLVTLSGPGTPGGSPSPLSQSRTGPTPAAGRCLYRSTRGTADPNGDLYAVVGYSVYYIDPDWNFHFLGQMQQAPLLNVQATQETTPVYMADNGTMILIVDGSPHGYTIDIQTRAFAQFTDPNFLGSTRVDFLDSFILMNVPGKNQWYVTPSLTLTPINPLAIGVKTAWSDVVSVVIAVQREAIVLGPEKGEVWYNAGTIPFAFQLLPGVILEQGIQAPYSACKIDAFAYWIASAPEGGYMAVKAGAQNIAQRISTHAIEHEWKTYPRVNDAIGSVYQIEGHVFVRFSFPQADKCWSYDVATEQWFEDLSIDQNGQFHRARNTFCAFCYGKNLGLDFSNGTLYEISQTAFTDGGQAIPWIRSFPHVVNELKYVQHPYFMADVQGGVTSGTTEGEGIGSPLQSSMQPKGLPPGLVPPGAAPPGSDLPAVPEGLRPGPSEQQQLLTPVVNFRMSKDGGGTWGKTRTKRNISSGHYRPKMRFRGLGVATDAVFELSSTAQMCPALNGAYIEPIPAQT